MIKAAIIGRISDENQEDGFSLDAQIRGGREHCKLKNFSLAPEHEFAFQETASKSQQRKKFDKVFELLWSDRSIKVLVVEKRDRLLRNHVDREKVKSWVLLGGEVHFYKEGKILPKYSDPSEWLVDGIMTSVNEYASMNIGREVIKGMVEKARQGWFPGRAWFGYYNYLPPERKDAKRRRGGEIRLHPWGRTLYLRMFELRTKADVPASLNEIKLTVLEEGLVPPEHQRTFSKSLVEKILKQPAYAGKFYCRTVESSELILFDGKHEAVITWTEWEHLQETFNRRGANRKKKGLLSSKMKCAECGCVITYDPKDKKSGLHYDYYRCSNGKGFHPKLIYISQVKILKQLSSAADLLAIPIDWAKQISDSMRATHDITMRAKREQAECYKSQLKALEGREDEVYDDFKNKLLDEDGYKRQLERVRKTRAELSDLVFKAQEEIDNAYIDTAEEILELCSRAKSLLEKQNPHEQVKFLEQLLSNPRLRGPSVEFDLRSPFDVVAKMRESGNWRSQGDLNPCILREREVS